MGGSLPLADGAIRISIGPECRPLTSPEISDPMRCLLLDSSQRLHHLDLARVDGLVRVRKASREGDENECAVAINFTYVVVHTQVLQNTLSGG